MDVAIIGGTTFIGPHAVAALRAARDGEDVAAIKAATEALSTSLSKIGEAMMKDQQSAGAQSSDAAAGANTGTSEAQTPPEAGTTDAEFTEKPAE